MAKVWYRCILLTGLLCVVVQVQGMQTLRGLFEGLRDALAAPLRTEMYDDAFDGAVELYPGCYVSAQIGEALLPTGAMRCWSQVLIFRFSAPTESPRGDEIGIIDRHFKAMATLAEPFDAIVWMDGVCNIFVFFPKLDREARAARWLEFLKTYRAMNISMKELGLNVIYDEDDMDFNGVRDSFYAGGVKLGQAFNAITDLSPSTERGMQQFFRRVGEGNDAFTGTLLEAVIDGGRTTDAVVEME